MSWSRVAMVFAHPGHELLVAGLMQRYRPQLLFLTRADSAGDSVREDLARDGLTRLGLADRADFLGWSEVESYRWALAGEVEPYRRIRDEIVDWLSEIRPTVVLGDAFELSNFHHDLGRLLLDDALSMCRATAGRTANYELPLVCRTAPGLRNMRFQEFPFGRFETLTLTPDELVRKEELRQWIGAQRAEAARAASLFPTPECEVYRRVPPNRDYTVPPPGLQRHYDDWGRMQVSLGKYQQPLLFDEHFVPIARAFGTVSIQRRAA